MKCVIGPNQTSGMCPVTSLQLQLQLPILFLAISQTIMLEKNNIYNLEKKTCKFMSEAVPCAVISRIPLIPIGAV